MRDLPLRGQERLWGRIRQEMLAATTRRHTTMIIAGPEGSGKTRIVREIALAAHRNQCRVITNELLDVTEPARSLPVRRLDLPQGHNLMVVICDDEDPPLLCAVDGPLLVIRTHRGSPDALASVAPETAIQVNIRPLEAVAVGQLVSDLVPRLGVVAPLADVVALAGALVGNPGAIVELLAGVARQSSDATELPACTRSRLERTLCGLSATAADLVVVASLTPQSRTVAELALRLGIGVPRAARAAQEAVDGGLLVADADRLTFPHETVRVLVAASCAPLAVSALGRLELDSPHETLQRMEEAPVELTRPPATLPTEPDGVAATEESDLGTLTPIQRRIALLVSQGLTNQAIARQVYLSPFTINYHLRQIYKKLGISTRAQLARLLPG